MFAERGQTQAMYSWETNGALLGVENGDWIQEIRGRGNLRQVSQLFTTLHDQIIAIKHVLGCVNARERPQRVANPPKHGLEKLFRETIEGTDLSSGCVISTMFTSYVICRGGKAQAYK